MAAILGHTFSLFLKFKGGKAVATTLGVFLVLVPYAILILLVVFFVIFGLTKYVSLASIFIYKIACKWGVKFLWGSITLLYSIFSNFLFTLKSL